LKLTEIGSLSLSLSHGRKRTDRVALSRYSDLKISSQTQALKTTKIGSLPPLPLGERAGVRGIDFTSNKTPPENTLTN
jgi:hypothetical protein